MSKLFSVFVAFFLISGCASYGVIDNDPLSRAATSGSYSIKTGGGRRGSGDVSLMLTFSGGGARAAALAYGVLKELRDTKVRVNGDMTRLLDQVDTISSVSGGSFASAYYGLYGDRIFEDFEQRFLRKDVQGALVRGLINPLHWFSSTGRTEMAVKFYEQGVFHGATFADLHAKDGPMILINATDLGPGARFTFIQEYFNLLCSDISSFPVARAVTASSAVPLLFNPVVVRNYDDCKDSKPQWLIAAEKRAVGDPELSQIVKGMQSYFDKDERTYAHFVDGGITDNLGLRALYEIVEVAGGVRAFVEKLGHEPPRRLIVISVNASTDPVPEMDKSNKQPSLEQTVNAVTDAQLHRYNAATLDLMKYTLGRWAREMSAPGRPVTSYFVQVGFRDVEQTELLQFFNQIPTSLSLTDEQVDRLIDAGRTLSRSNPDFQRSVRDLGRR